MDLIVFLLETAAIDFFIDFFFYTNLLRTLIHILFSPPPLYFHRCQTLQKWQIS